MRIQGLYDLDILIDDLSIFKAPNTTLIQANIYEAIMNPIPTCSIEMIIPLKWFDDRTLADGTIITFEIKSKKLNLDERCRFRLFNIEEIRLDQQEAHITLNGVVDCFIGYTPGNNMNMYGNSSDVFQKFASLGNLTPYIDKTNDSQLWVAGEKNMYQFLSTTASRGWIDETSAMFWCIDRKKNLLYKNLTSLFRNRQDKVYHFVQRALSACEDKEYEYSGVTGSIQAGSNNLKNEGYGGEDYYFDLLSHSLKPVAARKVVAESKFINISKELSHGLSDCQYPFNVGNFHPNYFLAKKQNKRILSTYSTYMILETQHLQSFRLGQIVTFEFMDSQTRKNESKAMSGVNMIDAIHTIITKEYIKSTVEIVSQGMNGIVTTREVY